MMKWMNCLIAIVLLFFVSVGIAGDIKGKVKVLAAKNSGNVVVYIDKVEGKVFEPPEKHTIMDQKNLVFLPHILPVVTGTTVDFLNSDDVLHNVFSPDCPDGKFNLGTWAKGIVKSFTFKKPGISTVLCNVHPEMEAYIVAVRTPYFAVSDKAGNFVIKDVPAGKYELEVWHEKRKAKPQEVAVPATGETTVNFELKR